MTVIKNQRIHNLSHFGWHIMRIAFGTVSFILENKKPTDDFYGTYSYMEYDNIDKGSERPISFPLKDNGRFKIANQKDFEKIPGSPIGYWLSERFIDSFLKFPQLGSKTKPKLGMRTGDNTRFLRFWHEVPISAMGMNLSSAIMALENKAKWIPYNKGGEFRKWYGNQDYVVFWENNGYSIKEDTLKKYPQLSWDNLGWKISNEGDFFKESITWSFISSGSFGVRYSPQGFIFDVGGSSIFPKNEDIFYLIGFLCSNVALEYLKLFSPTLNFQVADLKMLPLGFKADKKDFIEETVKSCIEISKESWDSSELSRLFKRNQLVSFNSNDIEELIDLYKLFWENKFHQLHKKEEKLNSEFIEIYGLENELKPFIAFDQVTILKDETRIENEKIIFKLDEILAQFVSYSVGCLFGRYSLDKEGLILANQGETIEDYFHKLEKQQNEVFFIPDEDNIIPILDDAWFEDDIVSRFQEFLKASFGEKNFRKNLAFVEECLGKDIKKYFVKDFYKDHIKRYKKRPIYWSFSSPKGHFNVIIYMHRYTPDTLNRILNNYLREFIEKLQAQRKNLLHIEVTGTPVEQNKARKDINKVDEMIADCRQYETDILYPLATERISIDLDDGVLVNYNKFGKAVTLVPGLNDKKAKDKVKKFDWIDTSTIR